MKTLKDVRSLILQNGGEIKIGNLIFKHEEGKDIDVYIKDRLVFWIHGHETDDSKLDEIYGTIATEIENLNDSSSIENTLRQQITDLEMANKEKEKIIYSLKEDSQNNEFVRGKVEAYEKLLISREVTIGK